MASVVTKIELDVEGLLAHIKAMLEKDPKAEIHINPPADTAIKVGPQPYTGSGGQPGGPGQGH